MTFYLIFPAVNEIAFRALYKAASVRDETNPNWDEEIAAYISHNKDDTLRMAGTSRLSSSKAVAMVAANAWLTITETIPLSWEYPDYVGP